MRGEFMWYYSIVKFKPRIVSSVKMPMMAEWSDFMVKKGDLREK